MAGGAAHHRPGRDYPMKRVLLAAAAIMLLAGAIAFSGGNKPPARADLQVDVEARNPWTNLKLNNDPDTFHFVVVSDRTGGHRARIFSEAVEQINLLQPAFVISVGDLIEGYTKDPAKLATQWKEFQTYAGKLQMPFFYVPGNHDLSNPDQTKDWVERFGRRYYHFVYRDVLFLAINSDDPSESDEKGKDQKGKISAEQIEYFQKVLKENPSPRWTIVCLHKPLWTQDNLATNGWPDVEELLKGRNYTVFAGHIHRYQKFVRNGMSYYQLATTGGASRLRGIPYGEFDHVAWVTMRNGGPVIANILLDGVLPENLKRTVTDEEGVIVYNRKPTHPASGKVLLNGSPLVGGYVTFYATDPKDAKKAVHTADAVTEPDGSFALSTYKAFDGAPEGEYKVTVVLREPFFEPSGKLGPNRLPERYATAAATELTATVKSGSNTFTFELTK
jgi:3',5'-cyclic AMP phosphodiesterase CpdA